MISLFDQLKRACASEWAAYTNHAFVRGLGDGTLPQAAFRDYLRQDYLFLIQFARAYGLAVFKSETIEEARRGSDGLAAILDETRLHVAYCQNWGIAEADLEACAEAPQTLAYTRFVLDRGMAGDLLDLDVALAPCVIGYAEIGAQLARKNGDRLAQNPYRSWIEAYAGADYTKAAAAHIEKLDRTLAARGGDGRMPSLIETFRKATILEAQFWETGLKASN